MYVNMLVLCSICFKIHLNPNLSYVKCSAIKENHKFH